MSDISKDVVKQIEAGAASVRAAGDMLNDRIKRFEDWLSRLPGRVEAVCQINSESDGSQTEHLSLAREGKDWRLSVYWYDHGSGDTHSEVLLRDAALERKMGAVTGFPSLLEAISKKQKFLATYAADAASEFDKFAEAIGMKGGE